MRGQRLRSSGLPLSLYIYNVVWGENGVGAYCEERYGVRSAALVAFTASLREQDGVDPRFEEWVKG